MESSSFMREAVTASRMSFPLYRWDIKRPPLPKSFASARSSRPLHQALVSVLESKRLIALGRNVIHDQFERALFSVHDYYPPSPVGVRGRGVRAQNIEQSGITDAPGADHKLVAHMPR